jgi:hypothetical protein
MVIEFKQPQKPGGDVSESIVVMRDGNQIVAMIGQDLQVGIGGFGDTAAQALRDLADRMEAENYLLPGIDF